MQAAGWFLDGEGAAAARDAPGWFGRRKDGVRVHLLPVWFSSAAECGQGTTHPAQSHIQGAYVRGWAGDRAVASLHVCDGIFQTAVNI